MNPVTIPEYIDNPPQIIFWEADELAPQFLLFMIGFVTGTLTWMLIPMFLLQKVFVRFKEGHMRGYFFHWLYRLGVLPLNRKFNNGSIVFYVA